MPRFPNGSFTDIRGLNSRLTVGVALLLLVVACGTVTEPVAQVNGEAISLVELQRETERVLARNRGAAPPDPGQSAQLRQALLDQLIDSRLLRQQAKSEGITVSSAAVDERLAAVVVANGGREQFLSAMQGQGLTSQELRRAIEDELLSERLSDRHIAAPATLEERRVRHVLTESIDAAQVARQRLVAGETWDKVAAELSIDPGTKVKGGDLGFLRRGQTVPDFDKPAFALPINELSQPMRTRFGYHVVQAIEARSQVATPEQAAAQRQQLFAEYLRGKRTGANITYGSTAPVQADVTP